MSTKRPPWEFLLHLQPQPFPKPAYCGTRHARAAVKTRTEFLSEMAAGHRMCKRCEAKMKSYEERDRKKAAERAKPALAFRSKSRAWFK